MLHAAKHRTRERLEVLAIKQSDLRPFLEEYGLAQKLDDGDLECPITGETLTWNNLGAIKVEGGSVRLYSVHANTRNMASTR
jgi:hypothetical protein